MLNLFCSWVCETNNNYLICIKKNTMWGGVSNQPFGTGWWPGVCREAISAHGLVAPIWLSTVWLGHKELHGHHESTMKLWGVGGFQWWWVFHRLKYRFCFSKQLEKPGWFFRYLVERVWFGCQVMLKFLFTEKKQGERKVFCVLVSLIT